MIKRVDHIKLKDSYGNKWALNLIKTFLDDNVEDGSFNTTIGPSATLGSKEMEGFWWTLENSKKRYDHDSKGRLEAMIGSNNVSLHILNGKVDENNSVPYKYILWKKFAPLAWFNFKVSK